MRAHSGSGRRPRRPDPPAAADSLDSAANVTFCQFVCVCVHVRACVETKYKAEAIPGKISIALQAPEKDAVKQTLAQTYRMIGIAVMPAPMPTLMCVRERRRCIRVDRGAQVSDHRGVVAILDAVAMGGRNPAGGKRANEGGRRR